MLLPHVQVVQCYKLFFFRISDFVQFIFFGRLYTPRIANFVLELHINYQDKLESGKPYPMATLILSVILWPCFPSC